ncbi:FAD-dependent oxidoreductase [Hymenobacter terricola]|uniref:FAD-dependent oxidoreductase n=1 Tax=Hymenobacter terricola TaxID=2819236 RepID=UPI001B315585|nr:FAD-dependent oxidoreductase [Hymenobacter terricola]
MSSSTREPSRGSRTCRGCAATRGYIPVNERLQTNVPRIWALGDVNGGPQFTHISLDGYRVVRDELFGSRTRPTSDRWFVASTGFITPPFLPENTAHPGLAAPLETSGETAGAGHPGPGASRATANGAVD